jgi:hypothetical protein
MLPTQYDLLVNVGVGVGNRVERSGDLGSLLQFYGQLMGQPGAQRLLPGGDLQIFTSVNLYETIREMLQLVGYTNTYAFAVDPQAQGVYRDPPLPPPPPSPEEQYVDVERAKVGLSREKTLYEQFEKVANMQLSVRKAAAEAKDTLAKAQQTEEQVRLEREQMMVDHQKAMAEMRNRDREIALRERELDLKAADLILKYQEAGVLPVEQHAILGEQLSVLSDAIKNLEGPLAGLTAPRRRVIRSDTGDILGTETEMNGRLLRHMVERDPEGNPVGVRMEQDDDDDDDDDDPPAAEDADG